MFEQLGLETLTAPQAALWFALALGCAFGALAQITRFCFRRMIDGTDRRQAAGVWLMALATATLGTQAAIAQGWIDFADHRFMVADLPVLAIALGGLAFGAGMILTRGCVSRLTVLGASGNLRAVLVLVVFALVFNTVIDFSLILRTCYLSQRIAASVKKTFTRSGALHISSSPFQHWRSWKKQKCTFVLMFGVQML